MPSTTTTRYASTGFEAGSALHRKLIIAAHPPRATDAAAIGMMVAANILFAFNDVWLRRIADFGYRTPDTLAVMEELQRLRFGAPATWPEPEAVFRRARQAVRELRRRAGARK